MTVRTDTPSVSAVSSTENPPKNRSSTTWLGRGSIVASSASASFKATTSTPGAGAATSAASSDSLSDCLDRAWPPAVPVRRPPARDASSGQSSRRSAPGSANAPRASRAGGRRTPARDPLAATRRPGVHPTSIRRAISRSSRWTSGARCVQCLGVTVAPCLQQPGHICRRHCPKSISSLPASESLNGIQPDCISGRPIPPVQVSPLEPGWRG